MKSIESMARGRAGLSSVSKGLIGVGVSAAFVALTLRGVDLTQVQIRLWEIDMGMLPHVIISHYLLTRTGKTDLFDWIARFLESTNSVFCF